MTLTVGSLCSGIGGLELGIERALGTRTVWQSELDPHASTVLARRWPHVPNHGDLTAVDWAQAEPVDLLCAGPPCQPVSQAGRRKGSTDERWLWPAVLAAVGALRPRWVMFENPMGLMTGRDDDEADSDPDAERLGDPSAEPAGGGWFGDVLRSLAEMGYLGRWGCLRSCCAAGAPHQRRRVFIVATPADPDGRAAGRDPGAVPRPAASPRRQGADVRPAGDGRATAADAERNGRQRRTLAGDHGEVAAGGRLLPAQGRGGAAADADVHGLARFGSDEQRARQGARPDPDRRGGPWGRYGPAVRRWEGHHGHAPHPLDDRGRLNPALPEWMLGFPPGWITDTDIPRTAQLRVLGNAVQPQVAEVATRLLLLPLIGQEAAA